MESKEYWIYFKEWKSEIVGTMNDTEKHEAAGNDVLHDRITSKAGKLQYQLPVLNTCMSD